MTAPQPTVITIRAKHIDGIHINDIRQLARQHGFKAILKEQSRFIRTPMYVDLHVVFPSERKADGFRQAAAEMLSAFGYCKKPLTL